MVSKGSVDGTGVSCLSDPRTRVTPHMPKKPKPTYCVTIKWFLRNAALPATVALLCAGFRAERSAAMPCPKKDRKKQLEAKAARMRMFRWPQQQHTNEEKNASAVSEAVADAARGTAASQQPDATAEVNYCKPATPEDVWCATVK